jgi:hypothetical protein
VTAVKTDPDGKILIQAVERSGGEMRRVQARGVLGVATVN